MAFWRNQFFFSKSPTVYAPPIGGSVFLNGVIDGLSSLFGYAFGHFPGSGSSTASNDVNSAPIFGNLYSFGNSTASDDIYGFGTVGARMYSSIEAIDVISGGSYLVRTLSANATDSAELNGIGAVLIGSNGTSSITSSASNGALSARQPLSSTIYELNSVDATPRINYSLVGTALDLSTIAGTAYANQFATASIGDRSALDIVLRVSSILSGNVSAIDITTGLVYSVNGLAADVSLSSATYGNAFSSLISSSASEGYSNLIGILTVTAANYLLVTGNIDGQSLVTVNIDPTMRNSMLDITTYIAQEKETTHYITSVLSKDMFVVARQEFIVNLT